MVFAFIFFSSRWIDEHPCSLHKKNENISHENICLKKYENIKLKGNVSAVKKKVT